MDSKGSIPFVYVVILAWNGRIDTLTVFTGDIMVARRSTLEKRKG